MEGEEGGCSVREREREREEGGTYCCHLVNQLLAAALNNKYKIKASRIHRKLSQ